MTEQLSLALADDLCRRDHAGCGVHHAVWEAWRPACWFVLHVGRFESWAARDEWKRQTAGWDQAVSWLTPAQVEHMREVGAEYSARNETVRSGTADAR